MSWGPSSRFRLRAFASRDQGIEGRPVRDRPRPTMAAEFASNATRRTAAEAFWVEIFLLCYPSRSRRCHDSGNTAAPSTGAGAAFTARLSWRLRPRVTQRSVVDALEGKYPMLRGTIRDHRDHSCGSSPASGIRPLSRRTPHFPMPSRRDWSRFSSWGHCRRVGERIRRDFMHHRKAISRTR